MADPKPPAASGDRYDAIAEPWGGLLQETLAALDTLQQDRAAHAAEVERLKTQLDERRIMWEGERESNLANTAELLRADGLIGELKAEVERLRGEVAERTQRAINAEVGLEDSNSIIDELRAEVERLRGEPAEAHKKLEVRDVECALWEKGNSALQAELAKARAERPMPTDEGLATVLWEAWYGKKIGEPPTDSDAPYAYGSRDFEEVARAAKSALLGVRREGVTPTREQIAAAIAKPIWVANWDPASEKALFEEERADTYEAADAVLALFGAEPKGQPEPATDDLDGMPTKWRERLETVERDLAAVIQSLGLVRKSDLDL